ncbi:ATP synthase subunit I [Pelosinus baikalensis]|uniref:ATP synthase subunit I n=1 Tax=Pelosinus baikalensis TaxID=2892015 RepID=A0ABS8HPQ0_9FIRM|nr:ATP synthase subunit I [Pelosinus baikalensis]MCC5464228.1 ATP synthase subunit I [Pelosinus baikalensis]
MQEYVVEIKKTIMQMLVWGSLICAAAYFTGHSEKIAGLIIGIFTSAIYFLLMGYRIKKSAEMPVNQALLYTKIGWLIRLSFIVAMLLLSIKLPGIDFWSAVFGLFSLQIVLFLQAVVLVTKRFFVKS